MIGLPSLTVETLRPVGLVLLEAIVLYFGYGALVSLVEPHVNRALRDR